MRGEVRREVPGGVPREVYSEEGQSLIQFAVMITFLLLFVSIAIDMGSAFSVRRQMQNAADAAALAAARELCLTKTNAEATAAARDMMLKNGVSNDMVAGSGWISFSDDDSKVTVQSKGTAKSIMGELLNVSSFPVVASANSACGRATAACGLWPIAFDLGLYEDAPCGITLVLWDAEGNGGDPVCEIGGKPRDVCDCYDCDAQGIGSSNGLVFTTVARGWMDFTSAEDPLYNDGCKDKGCGTSELACRVRNDSGDRIELPACIAGLRGVRASLKNDVNSRTGQTVRVPLYDSINCGAGGNCSGKDAESYHVTKFGCVTVGQWKDLTLNPLSKMPKSYKQITTKAILVTKNCTDACMTFCGATDGTKGEPWELKAASLTK